MRALRSVELSDPRFERDGLRQAAAKSASLKRRGDIPFFIPRQLQGVQVTTLLILLNGVYNGRWDGLSTRVRISQLSV